MKSIQSAKLLVCSHKFSISDMAAQYTRLPTNEETAIDFSSIFAAEKGAPPKYFSYSAKSSEYKSIFTYSKSDEDDVEPVPFGTFPKFQSSKES